MKVLIAGDFCPQHRVAEKFEKNNYETVLGEIKEIISDADYSIVNFECSVTKGGEKPIEKHGPNLQCSEKGIEAVKWAGFDCVTLANNHFLDYGCGLGRSLFFMASQVGCRASGIEYDYELCEAAIKNLERSKLSEQYKKSIRIVCTDARTYHVLDEDRFYFFNPFAGEILQIVIGRIRQSYYEHPRQIYLFFYYPYDDAAAALMTAESLSFVDEIDCTDLYEVYDRHERILVFEFA